MIFEADIKSRPFIMKQILACGIRKSTSVNNKINDA